MHTMSEDYPAETPSNVIQLSSYRKERSLACDRIYLDAEIVNADFVGEDSIEVTLCSNDEYFVLRITLSRDVWVCKAFTIDEYIQHILEDQT